MEALGDPTSYEAFTTILKRLVEERVPLTDMRTILEAAGNGGAVGGPGEGSLYALTERVRTCGGGSPRLSIIASAWL